MTLRSKAFLYLALGVLAFLLVIYFFASIPLKMSREASDKEASQKYIEKLKSAIENEFSHLDERTEDYADWDDTYEFMRSGNPDYIRNNFTPATFEDLVLNIAVFVDETGKVVYSTAYDLEVGKIAPPPQSFMKLVSPGSLLVTRGGPGYEKLSGIVLLPEGPLLVVSRPIRTSQRQGPPRGAVIFGRFLSDERIRELSELEGLSVEVKRVDEPLTGDFEVASRRLADGRDAYIKRASRDKLYGYILVKDLFGNPALVARVAIPPPSQPLFLMQENYIALVLFVCGAFFLVFLLWSIDRLVLSPVRDLAEGVRGIEQRGNLAIGVRLKGGAELSAIALGVNRLIEELVKRGIEVDVYKRACRRLLAEPWDWTLLCDIRGRIVDVSQELLRALGYVEDEMLGLDINEVFASGASDLKRHLTDSLGDGEHLMFESFLKRRNGGLVPVEVRCGRIEFPQGPLFRLVARDLTTEQELQDLRNQRDVFRRMLDGSVNPIIGLTREGVIHYANGSSSFILKGWGVTVGMEAPDEVKGAASSAFSLGLKRDAEVSVGEMRTLLSFVPHDDGVMVYGYAPAWDKGANGAKTAYALREKAIVGALPDAALLVDGDDKVVAVNPRFEETFGHVALGEAVDAVFGLIEHNLASPTCFADHGKMGSTSCLEEMVTLRDGRVFRASLIPLLAEGDVCGRLFYFKEIKTLDSSHAPVLGTYPPSLSPSFGDGLSYLELFANSAPFMVWMLSLDGSYSFVSSRFLGFLGADSERSSLLDIIHPEDVTLILNDVGSAFSGGGRVIREARVKSARGVKRVRLVGEPLSLPDGSFKGYFGTCEAIWEGNKSSQMGASKTRWWKRAIGLLGFFKELIFRR